ncbi:hypothetical protein CPB86DRAFT_718777 [Serendipita vermifera]|nr:hypothetical protein CPB86DRAFT_718777 [Serendipita vermifera]
MPWKAKDINPQSGTTVSPITLYYRDPLECIQSLLDRPSLRDHMEYVPRQSWEDEEPSIRVYSEILTGDWAWETQETLPFGGTLLPVLLGSDKTHLTVLAGDKKAWPLYLSLGNIKSAIRNKPSNRAWVLLAYLPIPHFEDPKLLHTTLQSRLFHQCIEFILDPLKTTGREGILMTDSLGKRRQCFPCIAAYLADYPEQLLINAAAANNSPTTTAGFHELGDKHPHPPRTRDWILNAIAEVAAAVDSSDIDAYQKAAKLKGLNGVDLPFWREMPGYRPELVICPDILHGLHRFWRDHILKWVIHLVTEKEFDARVKAVEPIVGMRHFRNGVSHLSQWTGKEDRELQRILLAVVAGAPGINAKAMRCLRAFHDFLYLVQYKSHSSETLEYLRKALDTCHRTKDVFISNGARHGKNGVLPHFKIPKLAALHVYIPHIKAMGSSPQFSTETTENCHQTMAKRAYKATNKRDFEKQMCRYLDRTDRIALLGELVVWWEKQQRINAMEEAIASCDADYQELARLFLEEELEAMETLEVVRLPRRRGGDGHIWHNLRPHKSQQSLVTIARDYELSDLLVDVCRFFKATPDVQSLLSNENTDVWENCRIHLPCVQDEEVQAAVRTVQALPPSEHLPVGRGSCVLIRESDNTQSASIEAGYLIAQVHLIFRISFPFPHPMNNVLLAYVQWFSDPDSVKDNIHMYRVQRSLDSKLKPVGDVVELESISRLVQLVPDFGKKVAASLNATNSVSRCKYFWVNSFADKEIYQSVW